MSGTRGWKHLGLALLLVGACSAGHQKAATGIGFDPAGFDGFDETHFELLAADCSFDGSGNMTITVGANETAYLFKRAADGVVVTNSNIGGAECTVATTKKITITSHDLNAVDTQKVIIDFYSGIFGLNSGGTPSLMVTLGAGTGDQLKIRGTPAVDTFTLGSNGATSYAAFQVAPAAARTLSDLSMTGVESVTVSTGAGNDTITGQGGAALGAGVTALDGAISVVFYGGDDNDTIISGAASPRTVSNLLNGGGGNDSFPQQSTLASDVMVGGTGTDTVDYSTRSNAVTVTIGANTAVAATGSLTAPAKAAMADNEYFVLNDGIDAVRFAFKVTSGFVESQENVDAGAVIIDISDAAIDTAIEVAATIYGVVNAQHAANNIAITPADPSGTADVDLTADAVGKLANITITTSNTPSFTVVGMSGGVSYNDGESGENDSLASDVENVVGGAGADTINASASAVAHVLTGMAGNDTLTGAGLVDFIYGGAGNDTLMGGAGADFLYGGANDDVLQGGTENDTINGGGVNCVAAVSAGSATTPTVPYVNATTCTSIIAAAPATPGVDTLDYSDRIDPVTVDLTPANLACGSGRIIGVEGECDVILTTGTGAATVANVRNIRGGSGADVLTGDGQDNIIWGGLAGDTIVGGGGNDALYGEGGNDTVSGGDGNDFVSGGVGTNILNGNAGLDTIDSSMGTGDTAACGEGDGDISLPGSGVVESDCEL